MKKVGNGIGNSNVKLRLGLNISKNEEHFSPSLQEGDARFRLIERKRQNVTDARDRLAEIAKQKDAREKINELKNFKTSSNKDTSASLQNKARLSSGGAIPVKRTVKTNSTKNGKISTYSQVDSNVVIKKKMKPIEPLRPRTSMSRKTSHNSGSLTRTLNSGIRPRPNYQPALPKLMPTTRTSARVPADRLARVPADRLARVPADRFHPLKNNPNVVTIRNEKLVQSHKTPASLRSANPQMKMRQSVAPNKMASRQPSLPRRPVSRQPVARPFKGDVWDRQSLSSPTSGQIMPQRLMITANMNQYMDLDAPAHREQRNYGAQQIQSYKRPFEDYVDSPQSPQKKQAVLSSSIISRLDQPQPQDHAGYKVVVTNLHPVVTYEDVEELFGNIGALKSVRIVRQGIAEIVYMNEDDARRSVEVYHNRQLDGQAMNVTLVSRKTFSTSSDYSLPLSHHTHQQSLPQRTSNQLSADLGGYQYSADPHSTKSVLRTAGGSNYRMYDNNTLPQKRYNKIAVPDVNTIHHALFSNRSANPDSNMQVYIKVPKEPYRMSK